MKEPVEGVEDRGLADAAAADEGGEIVEINLQVLKTAVAADLDAGDSHAGEPEATGSTVES